MNPLFIKSLQERIISFGKREVMLYNGNNGRGDKHGYVVDQPLLELNRVSNQGLKHLRSSSKLGRSVTNTEFFIITQLPD